MGKKFCNLCGWVWNEPAARVVDLRGNELADLEGVIREHGIAKLSADDETRCLEILARAGATPLPQYEAVRAGQEDLTVLETVAKATAGPGDTSAVIARDTDFHMDGYQFMCHYCGVRIAGIGNMPAIEVLSFPKVVEGRFLVFSDLCRAARKFLMAHESSQLEFLMRPRFSVDARYRDADSDLTEPTQMPVIFRDERGWRFHLGGSIQANDPLAGFALSLFRAYMASSVLTERLESGTLYVINQRRIAHRGIRVPGVDGKTVLRRVLLGRTEDVR